jgi:serine/threonine protein kinase
MPFSNRTNTENNNMQATHPTVLQERYALHRCMAETALGTLYWAHDLQQRLPNGERTSLLLFTVLPSLQQIPGFEQAFKQVMPGYQRPANAMPHISDSGKSADGTLWMAIQDISGMLLSERLRELDDRGMPLAEATALLDKLSAALANQRPEGILGFMEPGAVILNESGPCLLNAPIVSALRLINTGSSIDNRPTLRSGYVSPDVLLGEKPTASDDTFSIACIAYHLLQGHPPFGKQSALEAAVRNVAPASIRKLRPEAWIALQQGLSLQRGVRQPAPATLLRLLQRKQPNKFLLPIASLVAASAVAMTTYHWLSSGNTASEQNTQPTDNKIALEPIGSTTTPLNLPANAPGLEGESPTPAVPQAQESGPLEIDKLAEEAAARAAEEKQTADGDSQNNVGTLLEDAASAIRKGNVYSSDSEKPGAVDYLRKVLMVEPDNSIAKKMLVQMVDDQHAEAETLLANGLTDEATKLLSTTDKFITEFTLADSLKRQIRLEAELEQKKSGVTKPEGTPPIEEKATEEKATEASTPEQYIKKINTAIDKKNLLNTDENSENAVTYLNKLLDTDPKNLEGLKLLGKVVELQQSEAQSQIRKANATKSRAYIDASQNLIAKYHIENLVEEQIALEKRYREARLMGVFSSENKAETTSKTEDKPENAEASSQTTPAVSNETKPELPSSSPTPTARAPVPVEVPVPIERPVQAAPPINVPPIQRTVPTPRTIPEPPIPAPAPVYQAPAPANVNTFTPDVPDLMEVPLDAIQGNPQKR